MMTPSELFNNVNEVAEVVEESIEDKQVLEEDISHSVSLIDGAFRNIQEQILNSNRKELSPYKDQVIEVYNLCKDIKENQLPRYKKEVLQSDLRTESRVTELKKEFYETLEQRITETEETIKVYFREEVNDVNKLRASVVLVEKYINDHASDIVTLREEVFQELRNQDKDSEVKESTIKNIQRKLDAVGEKYEILSEDLRKTGIDYKTNQIVVQDKINELESLYDKKLGEISKDHETLTEGLLNEPPSTDNEDPQTPLDKNYATIEQLQSHYRLFVNRVQQQLATFGGGGETRLEFLDDIDRDTALIDGRVLKYDSSAGIWTGAVVTGGGGTSFSGDYNDLTNTPTIFTNTSQLTNDAGFITGVSTFSGNYNDLSNRPSLFSGNFNDLTNAPTGIVTDSRGSSGQLLQHDGSSFVGIASTGFRDYVINQGQGYYAYTTDFYTVGVANTTQEIEEGVWTILQPQVAATGLYNEQPTCMNEANGGDPWIGAGATIGTGQTEFSLAGTKAGTMCLVRTLIRFEPDTDETDLDLRLHFTTNTATQATGLYNFNTQKQALVMQTGAGVTYSSEEIISFFVGETLYGDTKADAGRFCIECNATTDGTLEIQGVTVMIDI